MILVCDLDGFLRRILGKLMEHRPVDNLVAKGKFFKEMSKGAPVSGYG